MYSPPMQLASRVRISEVDAPVVMLELPSLRNGDRVRLSFKLERTTGGRFEVLLVQGEYRVTEVFWANGRQEVTVESTGKSPSWRATKRKASSSRKLGPARFPKTVLT